MTLTLPVETLSLSSWHPNDIRGRVSLATRSQYAADWSGMNHARFETRFHNDRKKKTDKYKREVMEESRSEGEEGGRGGRERITTRFIYFDSFLIC